MVDVVNVSHFDPGWNWLARNFSARPDLRWTHFSTQSTPVPAWLPRRQTWQRIACAWAACGHLEASDAILVSHGPRMTMYAGLGCSARRQRVRHLAYSFNYTDLPSGLLRRVQARVFATVDRFVVFSTLERSLYAEYFGLDPDRIDVIPWAVEPPRVPSDAGPLVAGDYVCAVGSQARDYAVLLQAMKSLPAVRLVIVATPESMAGLSVPPNVEVRTSIPYRDAINVIAHSRFMILPLRDSRVPCGHVTLVSAMHLCKAIVATGSAGIADYVQDGVNARLVPPRDAAGLAAAIDELMQAPDTRERLAQSGHRFSMAHCTEANVVAYFERLLQRWPTDRGEASAAYRPRTL